MAHDKIVTLKEIAEAAGVSVMTVSRALRKQSNVSEETQTRIQHIATQLGYRPNPLVSALMSYRRSARPASSHSTLAYITNFPAREEWKKSPLFHDFFKGAKDGADRHGYQLE